MRQLYLKPSSLDIKVQTFLYRLFSKRGDTSKLLKWICVLKMLSDLLVILVLIEIMIIGASLDFLLALGAGIGVGYLVKLFVKKPRPKKAYNLASSDYRSFLSNYSIFSTIVLLYYHILIIPAVTIMILRVLSFEHYITDVLFGVLVGVIMFLIFQSFGPSSLLSVFVLHQ